MDYRDVIGGMRNIGLPSTYNDFEEPVDLPYTIITSGDNGSLMADNINYKDIAGHKLELYTADKHPPTEKMVQDKLKELGIAYQKLGPIPIESENMYQTIYEFQLI